MRLLIERVAVTVIGASEHAEVEYRWVGGRRTRHALVRSMRRTAQLARHGELLECLRALHVDGRRTPTIAWILVAEGRTSAHGEHFAEGSVRALLTRMGLRSTSQKRPSAIAARQEGELTVPEAAACLNLPERPSTLVCTNGAFRHGGSQQPGTRSGCCVLRTPSDRPCSSLAQPWK